MRPAIATAIDALVTAARYAGKNDMYPPFGPEMQAARAAIEAAIEAYARETAEAVVYHGLRPGEF